MAAKTFTTDKQLKDEIIRAVTTATNHVGKVILQKNEKFIDEVVYDVGGGGYPRTKQFRKAWEWVDIGFGDVGGEFRYTSEGMTTGEAWVYYHDRVWVYPIHQSVWRESQVGNMADLLYTGGMGCIPRPTGRNAYAKLDKWLSVGQFMQTYEGGLGIARAPYVRVGTPTVSRN